MHIKNYPLKTIIRRTLLVIGLFAVLCSMVGCGGDSELKELKNYVKSTKARKNSVIEPAPEFERYAQFQFPETKRRDPFQPLKEVVSLVANHGVQPDLKRRREALESYPLDALRMLGTLKEGHRIWAMVGATDGKVYRVTVGNHMGKNFGRVNKIELTKILLTETVRENNGWRRRPATIILTKPK